MLLRDQEIGSGVSHSAWSRLPCLCILVLAMPIASARAQGTPKRNTDFLQRWQARATATQAQQPKWIVPVISPFPMIAQVFRTDFVRQLPENGGTTWNYGGGKGFNLIVAPRTQLDLFMPPFLDRTPAPGSTADPGGAGDAFGLLKFRIATGNAEHGSYIISALLGASIPTGSYRNGSKYATLHPQISGGKGFGRFDVLSTIGGVLPVADGTTLGRTVNWNTVAQYHLGKYLWPEVEDNAMYFHGGAHDGRVQNYISPGMMVGVFKLRPQVEGSRLGIGFGAGIQIAASSYHSNNHIAHFSTRLVF